MSQTTELSPISLGTVVPNPIPLTPDTGKGVNETYLGPIQTDEGRIKAYIKVLPEKQLVNELVACVLGRSMGFPVLEGFLLQVHASDIPQSDILKKLPNGQGYAFGSKAVDDPPLQRQVKSSFDWGQWFTSTQVFPQWKDIVVFDDWIANSDRHFNNILVSPDDNSVSWIDHSHCFTGKNWDFAKWNVDKDYFNYMANHFQYQLQKGDAQDLKNRAAELANKFNNSRLYNIQSASQISIFLSHEERDALQKFVIDRIQYLEYICSSRYGIPMLRLIP